MQRFFLVMASAILNGELPGHGYLSPGQDKAAAKKSPAQSPGLK